MQTKFKAQSHSKHNSVLRDGTHLVSIADVSNDVAKAFPHLWTDQTPQLRFKFKSAGGAFISQWVNILGYHTKESIGEVIPGHITFKQHPVSKENFAVDVRNNKRIENPDKTAICHAIICRIASSAGFLDGTEFSIGDLIGKQLYITVKGGKVTHTHTIQEMTKG